MMQASRNNWRLSRRTISWLPVSVVEVHKEIILHDGQSMLLWLAVARHHRWVGHRA